MEQHLRNSDSGPSKIPTLDVPRKVGNPWGILGGVDSYHPFNDATMFSSSLPVLPHEKLNRTNPEHYGSIYDGLPKFQQKDELDEIEANKVGCLPGNEDELLAGIMDDFDLSGLPSQLEDLEDDLFDSGGGMEMDLDAQESIFMGMSKLGLSEGVNGNGIAHYVVQNGGPTVVGEHPFGEHPSRTLFVRNINSNVEESELRSLFEQYGDIRTLYTACKHRGFVMISYYDIRAARTAMRALQNKPLRRRKLDIHFSIPKDNPSEKDINQGTLVVFNLDASVSNDDLRQIFGAYGEVKEIRETPHKRHHKFIEFYDVRAADAALKALNGRDIAGKRIKLEPSRPGGARRNLVHQLTHELEQDETRSFLHQVGSPIMTNSPPGNWMHFSSPVDQSPLKSFSRSPGFEQLSPVNNNHLTNALASVLPNRVSNPVKIAPIGKDNPRSPQASLYPHNSHSFSNQKLGTASPGPTSSLGETTSIGMLSGPQFLWGSPTPKSPNWPTSSVGPIHTYSNKQTNFQQQHHVGSAPSFGYFPESPDTSFISAVGFGGMGVNHNINNNNTGSYMGVRSVGFSPSGNVMENGSPSTRMMQSFPRNSPVFYGGGSYQGTIDGLGDRSRTRRVDYAVNQIENKNQYQLDLEKIINGEDTRTTLMIKNIPNKYSSKMLLAAIDENHRGAYDFLYLPIDFKNKCNVGYAFINMVSPSQIISFYQAFNGKKWEKFNSEKVASLAYARIQGKAALVTHFQNSSLMNEDKHCRPILVQAEGQGTGDKESLPYNNLNMCIRLPDGSYLGDSLESPTSDPDEKLDN